VREVSNYEQLHSLDALGVEDRGENDQLDMTCMHSLRKIFRKKMDGRYEVNIPWILGNQLSEKMKPKADKIFDRLWENQA